MSYDTYTLTALEREIADRRKAFEEIPVDAPGNKGQPLLDAIDEIKDEIGDRAATSIADVLVKLRLTERDLNDSNLICVQAAVRTAISYLEGSPAIKSDDKGKAEVAADDMGEIVARIVLLWMDHAELDAADVADTAGLTYEQALTGRPESPPPKFKRATPYLDSITDEIRCLEKRVCGMLAANIDGVLAQLGIALCLLDTMPTEDERVDLLRAAVSSVARYLHNEYPGRNPFVVEDKSIYPTDLEDQFDRRVGG